MGICLQRHKEDCQERAVVFKRGGAGFIGELSE